VGVKRGADQPSEDDRVIKRIKDTDVDMVESEPSKPVEESGKNSTAGLSEQPCKSK
jgi:hypothetical protein